jgi:hypothetical protein
LCNGKISGRNSRGLPKSLRTCNSAIALPYKVIIKGREKKKLNPEKFIDFTSLWKQVEKSID